MKTILLIAAAMGLTVTVAAAECAGHAKLSTSADSETKVASAADQTPAADAATTVKAEEKKAQ